MKQTYVSSPFDLAGRAPIRPRKPTTKPAWGWIEVVEENLQAPTLMCKLIDHWWKLELNRTVSDAHDEHHYRCAWCKSTKVELETVL